MIERAAEHEAPAGTLHHVRASILPARLRDFFGRRGITPIEVLLLGMIVGVAAFLRLLHIEVTDFDYDQANVFGMAYGAIHHGWLVATANGASIPILNPPAVIYLLMLPAALSADPLWAAVMIALVATLAVLLTYVFVRRYYNLTAAVIAALLFATAERAIFYSRFIWQQNFLPFFVLLFFLVLFRGVVERRKGWLAPAVLLLGLLYQLHATSSLLIGPLVIALLLSPGTIRWRDIVYAVVALVVLYFPYMLWEIEVHFADIQVLLAQSRLSSYIDGNAFNYYLFYLSPFATTFTTGQPFAGAGSMYSLLSPWLAWLEPLLVILVAGGAILLVADVTGIPALLRHNTGTTRNAAPWWGRLWNWWQQLRADPYRCGALVLLSWQIIPLLALSRHSVPIYPHYLIVLMPGQFIFAALFLARMMTWLRASAVKGEVREDRVHRPWWIRPEKHSRLRIGILVLLYAVTLLIVIAQSAGSSGNILDFSNGRYVDSQLSRPYYNDLHSLQRALRLADERAQQYHVQRLYIATDDATQAALTFLASQLHTPATVFDATRCLVLPNPARGPALLLLGPYSSLASTMLTTFAHATLIAQPQWLGGAPFQLYMVRAGGRGDLGENGGNGGEGGKTFQHNLTALDTRVQHMNYQGAPWLVTRWGILRQEPVAFRVTYGYSMTARSASDATMSSSCAMNSIQEGDQLLIAFEPLQARRNAQLSLAAQYSMQRLHNLSEGPVTLETDAFYPPQLTALQTGAGQQSMQLLL